MATKSAVPRELHKGYVGTILPYDDPFWTDNQPGNLYGCKCDWKTTSEKVTKSPESIVKPSEGLEGNPAVTKEIFSDNHSYFKVRKNKDIEKFIEDMEEE